MPFAVFLVPVGPMVCKMGLIIRLGNMHESQIMLSDKPGRKEHIRMIPFI